MACLIVDGPGLDHVPFFITGPQLAIGRNGHGVHLRHIEVSHHHCRIVVRGQGFVVVDESVTGTFLNGERIESGVEVPLHYGDVLTIGPYTVEFVRELPPDNRTTRGPEDLPLLVGDSPAMAQLREDLHDAVTGRGPILICGETGTGKSLAARMIHLIAGGGPFEVVNSATLKGPLVGAMLFGHKKGAFTGAFEDRDGHFQRAHQGILFLDEVGDLPLESQGDLLLALQDGEVQRVGGDLERVSVRVVAATHRDLDAMVEKGTFRSDLLFRLRTHVIRLPPLRARRGDIPVLIDTLLERDHPGVEIAPAAVRRLTKQRWRGNVRELRSTLHRLAGAAGKSRTIRRLHVLRMGPIPLREDIIEALDAHTGERDAATELGISRGTLRRLMKEYGIPSRPRSSKK